MSAVYMLCGHSTTGTMDGKPACVICIGSTESALIVAEKPDLTGRKMKCGCGRIEDSRADVFGFEYLGPASRNSIVSCKCGYFDVAHRPEAELACKVFRPVGPLEFDRFYCGCRGWD